MVVSNEFKEVVQEKDILKVRIMLKDSLLIDRSFTTFEELVNYAQKLGLDVWVDSSDDSIEKVKRPWTVDLMNDELTLLISDFTKERVDYIKQIIKEIYPEEKKVVNHGKISSKVIVKDNNVFLEKIQNEIVILSRIELVSKNENGEKILLKENLKEVEKIVKEIEKDISKMGYSEKKERFKFQKSEHYSNVYKEIQAQISELSSIKINNKNLGKIRRIAREIKEKILEIERKK
ncbi:hypothetical protein IBB3154_0761 [Ligilactobacillus salivarius]|uniref:Uncharacterized protein n=1 Tax=Ligilactobacillus salivarius TaxID=1624 RepID=A0A921IEX3_9LACO|nr:hypothetical protein [Ligilactobacillus salivarius]MDM8223114.1 hypothetical protein [Ligilactobacillus salivarius]QIG36252.1 hypothetical protein IBB3154_0761 [Ligilactobacillus salivarius]HJG16485.1 hypothetical protein [Ligilactobacillus salivarius]